MRQILTLEDLKKYEPDQYSILKSKFGEDYDLMHEENDMSIRLKDLETRIHKLRRKIGMKFQRVNHDLMAIEIKLERWDSKNKKWILDRIIPGQSYTRNYIKLWWMMMASNNNANLTILRESDGGGVSWNYDWSSTIQWGFLNMTNSRTDSTVGTSETTKGIMIGSGTNAFDLDDTGLQTKELTSWIWDLMTAVSGVIIPALNGQSLEISVSRLFRNLTGSSVDISELALSGHTAYDDQFGLKEFFCFERTVLGSVFAVATAETFRVTYTLRVTNA